MSNVAKTIIRRDRLGWRWRVMDYDQQVDTGTKRTWMGAYEAAEVAKRRYVSRLRASPRTAQ